MQFVNHTASDKVAAEDKDKSFTCEYSGGCYYPKMSGCGYEHCEFRKKVAAKKEADLRGNCWCEAYVMRPGYPHRPTCTATK